MKPEDVMTKKRTIDPVCPFSWTGWSQFDTAGFTFDEVEFTEDFGGIAKGKTFSCVSVDFERGMMECYEPEAQTASTTVAFKLAAVAK